MIYIILLVLAGISIYYYWKTLPEINRWQKILLGVLRMISLTIVVLILLNPVLRFKKKIPHKPEKILLLDNSISMEEESDQQSKFANYKSSAETTRKILQAKGYNAHIREFSDGLDGNRQSTRLAKTLNEVREQVGDIQELILFSDGWFDDKNPDFIENIYYPVNIYQTDFKATGYDLEISGIKYNQRAWLTEQNPFIVDVSAENYQGKAELDFFVDNQKVTTKTIDFAQESYQQLLFEHEFTETGLQKIRFTVRTDSLQELQSENNEYPGAVLVLTNKAKVVVISDQSSWDGRFIIQTLEQNQRFESLYLHKDNQLKHEREVVDLRTQLQNCKVLFLLNYGSLYFNNSQMQILERYLNNGGGILIMGQPVESISSLLPVTATGIHRSFEGSFRLTQDSDSYQSFDVLQNNLEEIPPLKFYYVQPRLSATVFAEFAAEQTPPAIVFQEFGNGKVLYFSFLDFWKWQLWGEDDHYREFTSNILQWLSSSRTDNFFAWSEQNSYLMGETAIIRLTAFDEKYAPVTDLEAEISITKDNEKIVQDYVSRENEDYYFEFDPQDPGSYQFEITDTEKGQKTEGRFIVTSANSEIRDRGINTSLLNFLADQTDGSFFENSNFFENYPKAEIEYLEKNYEIPIYKKWYTMLLFLLCFCSEIFFRKRWGLL